jgi:streptogramin lyase
MLSVTAGLAVILSQGVSHQALAAGAALTGQVSSAEEGNMEGVVVSAKKPGSTVMVSVTTDAQGRYTFPEGRLDPGQYNLAIRAVGYDISAPTAATVTASGATADIKLQKTKNLASQLTNAEWMISIPGTEDQKAQLLNCTSCHTLERIVRSTHDSDEFTQVISRMAGYGAVSQPIKPQRMLDLERSGAPEQYRKMADYLATINLSTTDKWKYDLKTLPRPTGRSTRAIVTEYTMPRSVIEPHDVIARDGVVWYSDFGNQFISKFDPKTLQLVEYPVKKFKENAPEGNLSIDFDTKGTIWFDTMYQGSLGNLDPKTGEIKYYPLDPKWNDVKVQLNFTGLHHEIDGKVWTKSVGTQDIFRVDLASGTWEKFHPTDEIVGGSKYGIYQVASDSQNNLWMAEFTEGHLGKIDAKTLKVTWYAPPTPHARLRRMVIDDKDQIMVTEYRGNKIAVFDPKTEKFTEYALPTQYTSPYRATFDHNGEIWTGGMATDRVVRFDPKAGKSVEYLMPKDTNMRTVFVDNTTSPVTFWVGSNHDAGLVKVEPLD